MKFQEIMDSCDKAGTYNWAVVRALAYIAAALYLIADAIFELRNRAS